MADRSDILKALDTDAIAVAAEQKVEITDSELCRAENCTHALPSSAEPVQTLFQVAALGRAENERGHGGDTGKSDAVKQVDSAAALLTALRVPFTLGFESDNTTARVLIGADGLTLPAAQAMLSGLYGIARLTETDTSKEMRLATTSSCECIPVFRDEREMEEPLNRQSLWMNRVASAAIGRCCRVMMTFAPVDEAWLDEEIHNTLLLMDKLSTAQKSAVQLTRSSSVHYELEEFKAGLRGAANQLGRGAVQGIRGQEDKIKINLSDESVSASRTVEQEYHRITKALETLKSYLRRLDWLRRSGAWGLSVRVSANDADTRHVIERIIGAEAEATGYACLAWNAGASKLLTGRASSACALLPINRIGGFFGFPGEDFPGFQRLPLTDFEINPPGQDVDGQSGAIGHPMWNDRMLNVPFTIPRSQLNRHAFICGMTGSGKTNTVCALLGNGATTLPFMVIEPVKGEYKALAGSVPGLEVRTMEAGSASQFHTNPFWFPEGGNLQYHIDSLRAIIASAFELTAAMPNILEQCLTRVYVNLGWNIAQGRNAFSGKLRPEMLYPTFSMLCQEIEHYLKNSDFAAEVKSNYKGALLSRLQSFTCGTKGILMDRQVVPPFEDWIQRGASCVIELEALADDAEKAIVMGVLLSQYFQCIKRQGSASGDGLKHVIIIEEAHHLFKDPKDSGNAEGSVSRMHLVEMLSNMLAEIRAYGEGIFIVDQSPTSISPQVIKNTAVKVVHRVDYGEDLELLRHALLLRQEDMNAPAELDCGHALVRYGALRKPMHVKIDPCNFLTQARIGGRHQDTVENLSAQHVIDVLQINVDAQNAARELCRKFVNHLLFDGPESVQAALVYLKQGFIRLAENYGIDPETLAGLKPTDYSYIYKTFAAAALVQTWTKQGLLRGRLEMAVDRYFTLQFARSDGLRACEWQALRDWCGDAIYPLMAQIYRSSVDEELHHVSNMFTSNVRAAMSNILRNMQKAEAELHEIPEWLKDEDLARWDAEKGTAILATADFLVRPVISETLWEMYQLIRG